MTTFEHAMVGVTGALATGVQNRHGWKIIALAGAAAIVPDWDGLTIVGGIGLFDHAHRVWGHNLLLGALLGLVLATLDYRFDLATRLARGLNRIVRNEAKVLQLRLPSQRNRHGYLLWCVVAVAAVLSHLPADLVYSGGEGLSDWELQLFWPFTNRGFVFPMVSWGDPGATLIFVVGMFAMVRWPRRLQAIGAVTLLGVIAYVGIRGALR